MPARHGMSKEDSLMLMDGLFCRGLVVCGCLLDVTNAAGFVARFRYQLECSQSRFNIVIVMMAAIFLKDLTS